MAALARAPPGSSFSIPIKAAIKTIQPILITPSANSAAIKAQQQPDAVAAVHEARTGSGLIGPPRRSAEERGFRSGAGRPSTAVNS